MMYRNLEWGDHCPLLSGNCKLGTTQLLSFSAIPFDHRGIAGWKSKSFGMFFTVVGILIYIKAGGCCLASISHISSLSRLSSWSFLFLMWDHM